MISPENYRAGDWICYECQDKDSAFDTAELALQSGDCERCDKESVPLVRIKGVSHGEC